MPNCSPKSRTTTCTNRGTRAHHKDEKSGEQKANLHPDRGDIIWVTLDPQAGREQAGRRPALVLSPAAYNGRVGLALLCPITSHAKGYPFEVALPEDSPIAGVVLVDQIKSLDWRSRQAEKAAVAPPDVVHEVLHKLSTLLGE